MVHKKKKKKKKYLQTQRQQHWGINIYAEKKKEATKKKEGQKKWVMHKLRNFIES